jgi:hypothetical protein
MFAPERCTAICQHLRPEGAFEAGLIPRRLLQVLKAMKARPARVHGSAGRGVRM